MKTEKARTGAISVRVRNSVVNCIFAVSLNDHRAGGEIAIVLEGCARGGCPTDGKLVVTDTSPVSESSGIKGDRRAIGEDAGAADQRLTSGDGDGLDRSTHPSAIVPVEEVNCTAALADVEMTAVSATVLMPPKKVENASALPDGFRAVWSPALLAGEVLNPICFPRLSTIH